MSNTPAALHEHPFIRRLAALGLDPDDFVIFGSGPLLAHGIRTAIRDLDVVARDRAWRRACEIGLPAAGGITGAPAVQFWGGKIMLFRDWITPDWDPGGLIDRAEVIAELRFAPLADVLAYKLLLQRPKDLTDIQGITAHGPCAAPHLPHTAGLDPPPCNAALPGAVKRTHPLGQAVLAGARETTAGRGSCKIAHRHVCSVFARLPRNHPAVSVNDWHAVRPWAAPTVTERHRAHRSDTRAADS